jgi:ATPase subunit of ABC transporter with duplicated ATPase domains
MSMLLVHELHEARDRILLLRQHLTDAREKELAAYHPFLNEQIDLLSDALEQAKIPERYRVAVVGRFKVGKSSFINKLADERLAGVDTNPETAAISVFRYDTQARAEVEVISKEAWDGLAADHAADPKSPDVKRYDRFVSFNDRPPRKDREGRVVAGSKFDLVALAACLT